MKIHYLSASEVPSRTANSVHVMKMCSAMAYLGHDVVLFARPGADAVSDPFDHYGVAADFSIQSCVFPKVRGIGNMSYARHVRRCSRQRGLPDLYYARHVYSLAAVARLGVPLMLEVHALPDNRIHRLTQAWLMARPNLIAVVAISDALRRDYLTTFPTLASERILVAHDGADEPPPIPPRPIAWPGRPEALQVGYIGHLYPGRGIDLIIGLANRLDTIDFHVIGGSDAEILRWREREQGKASNLHFHGYVPHGRLHDRFARLDVLLAPYQHKVQVSAVGRDTARWMSPMKLFEYMSYGKAIVCSDMPVLREVLDPDVTALLVPPDDIDAWAAAVTRLQGAEIRQRIGSAAEAKFRTHYTWRRRAEALLTNASRPTCKPATHTRRISVRDPKAP